CPGAGLGPEAETDPALLRASSPDVARRLRGLALVRGGFVSEEEAVELLREVEPGLGRGRYQNDHWDRVRGARSQEFGGSGGVVGSWWVWRVRAAAFWGPRAVLRGLRCVRPPPQFCGCTIAGLSLLSPSVLRLRSLQDPQDWLELLLEPGSLYVLRAAARYEFTHEILPDEESFFGGLRVPRGRRVALIFRNDPSGENPPSSPRTP
ncbi:ALKB7 dioxygenase, partial [Aphelocoma coerulescens]|nr:ALKB7 dioxygenase [Aphelocoma coerulescens]